MTNPNESTLTCSEVVERLATEAYGYDKSGAGWAFNREKAAAILHSWRERRVQELERLESAFRSGSPADLWSAAKEVFAGREQIRKGAKHD